MHVQRLSSEFRIRFLRLLARARDQQVVAAHDDGARAEDHVGLAVSRPTAKLSLSNASWYRRSVRAQQIAAAAEQTRAYKMASAAELRVQKERLKHRQVLDDETKARQDAVRARLKDE